MKSHMLLVTATFAVATMFQSVADAHSFKRWRAANNDRGGIVYAMNNSPAGNKILLFERNRWGKLHALPWAARPTGGLGAGENSPGDPLGSQGSLVYDRDLDMLFAVNAGNNTVTAFNTRLGVWLQRTAVVDSGGYLPVSVAVNDDLLYVLNAGGSGAVVTFGIEANGDLVQLHVMELGLSNASTIPFDRVMAPGQVGVDALKRRLIVVNAAGQELLVSTLDDDGIPSANLVSTPTPGIVPFAFDVTEFGSILVAEAGSGSVSSFDPALNDAPLMLSAGAVPNGQGATCWIVVHDDGFVFVSNTASDTLSSYRFSRTGKLTLLEGVAATTGDAPTDMTLAGDGRFIYSLDGLSGTISGFAIDAEDGGLRAVETESGLPASLGIQGIAARDWR